MISMMSSLGLKQLFGNNIPFFFCICSILHNFLLGSSTNFPFVFILFAFSVLYFAKKNLLDLHLDECMYISFSVLRFVWKFLERCRKPQHLTNFFDRFALLKKYLGSFFPFSSFVSFHFWTKPVGQFFKECLKICQTLYNTSSPEGNSVHPCCFFAFSLAPLFSGRVRREEVVGGGCGHICCMSEVLHFCLKMCPSL